MSTISEDCQRGIERIDAILEKVRKGEFAARPSSAVPTLEANPS